MRWHKCSDVSLLLNLPSTMTTTDFDMSHRKERDRDRDRAREGLGGEGVRAERKKERERERERECVYMWACACVYVCVCVCVCARERDIETRNRENVYVEKRLESCLESILRNSIKKEKFAQNNISFSTEYLTEIRIYTLLFLSYVTCQSQLCIVYLA